MPGRPSQSSLWLYCARGHGVCTCGAQSLRRLWHLPRQPRPKTIDVVSRRWKARHAAAGRLPAVPADQRQWRGAGRRLPGLLAAAVAAAAAAAAAGCQRLGAAAVRRASGWTQTGSSARRGGGQLNLFAAAHGSCCYLRPASCRSVQRKPARCRAAPGLSIAKTSRKQTSCRGSAMLRRGRGAHCFVPRSAWLQDSFTSAFGEVAQQRLQP